MTTGCMIGWYDTNGYSSTNGLQDMEEILDTRFAAVRIYHAPPDWGTVKALVATVINDGRLPVVSHKLPKVGNAWVTFHSTTTYDAQLNAIVDHYRDLAPAEIVVIFHHEPYGNSNSGSQAPSLGTTTDFKKAFRKFANAFTDLPHVRIGYCEVDSRARATNDPCYPGSDIIDVLAHDVYNWGNYSGHSWEDPDEMFAGIVAKAKAVNKPLIFGEIGSHPGGYSGHDRGDWIRKLAAYFKTGDAAQYVLGFCYFHRDNHDGSGHYWRFAQGDTAADHKDDFIAAFSDDPFFLTTPIPVSLQARTVPGSDLGENHPSGGTPTYIQGKKWGRKDVTDGVTISEVSGLCSSPKGGAWAIRDSGLPESLYWMTQTSRGNLAAREIPISGVTNGDWEDCIYAVEGGTPYIYVHDNRDGNGAGANPKRLYKIAEPSDPATATGASKVDTRYWKFPTSASSSTCGSKQNCEAIIIFKGILYGIQKTDADESEVYRIGAPSSLSTTDSFASATEGTLVGTIGIHCPSGFSLHADGQTVLTFQHGQVKIFRGKGDTIESLLTGKNTKIMQDDEPTGSFEGGDWFPYQSADFLVIGENRITGDYDVTESTTTGGTTTTTPVAAYGGGIPSTGAFGTLTATLASGVITVTEVGAILSASDYDRNEEEAGLDFGILTVTEIGAARLTGLASTGAFGTPSLTRSTGPGYWFSPPITHLQPFAGVGARGSGRLFARLAGVPEPTNLYLLVDGSVAETPPWDRTLIVRTYHGGHIFRVDDAEADILLSAGYGAYLSAVPATASPAPPNLFTTTQATFETGTGGWVAMTSCTVAHSSTVSADGAYSLAMTATDGGSVQARSPLVAISPSTEYTALLSMWAPTTGKLSQLVIYWYASDGTTLLGGATTTGSNTSDWTHHAKTSSSPADATYAAVAGLFQNATVGQIFYLDRASLKLGSDTVWSLT